MPRDFKKEYEAYHASPEQRANRAARNRARRAYEKANGDLPPSVDVAHKKALSKGGNPTSLTNLKAEAKSSNRSFARTKTGALKSEVSKREKSR